MMEKDGSHVSITFLLRDCRPVAIYRGDLKTQGQKYIYMRKVGEEVLKVGADAVISIGEAWQASPDPTSPFLRPQNAQVRSEWLVGILVSRKADPVMLRAEIVRERHGVALKDTEKITGSAHFMFAPIYKVWGKPIPGHWLEQDL